VELSTMNGTAKGGAGWVSLVVLVLALGVAAPAVAQRGKSKKNDRDDVVGIIWHYSAKSGDDVESGQLRVFHHAIYRGAKQVGKVDPVDQDNSKFTITAIPKLNGEFAIRRTWRNPPLWRGVLEKKDGSRWRVEFDVKNR
jgi:hypothetical protein